MLQVFLQDDGHPWKDLCTKPVPRLNVCSSEQFFSLLAQRASQSANISKVATLGQKKKKNLGKRMENGRPGVKFKFSKSLANTLTASSLLFRVKRFLLQKEPEALDYPCKTGQGFDL